MRVRRYWAAFFVVVAVGFGVVAAYEPRIRSSMPPIPARVVTDDGREVVEGAAIRRGQDVWRSIGGQEVGSIWGHGAYVAPDWTADWLHREAVSVLDGWARREGAGSYDELAPERQAALRERLALHMRKNTFDPGSGSVTISRDRARAYAANAKHYASVFRDGVDEYAIPQARSPTRRSSRIWRRSSGGRAGRR